MAPRARNKVSAPMFGPKVFRKQMCFNEECFCDVVRIFRPPPNHLAPGALFPLILPRYASGSLT